MNLEANWQTFCRKHNLTDVENDVDPVTSGALRALVARPRSGWYRYETTATWETGLQDHFEVDYFPRLDSWLIKRNGDFYDSRFPFSSEGRISDEPLERVFDSEALIHFKYQGLNMWGSLMPAIDERFEITRVSIGKRRFAHFIGGNVIAPHTINEGNYTELIIDGYEGFAHYIGQVRSGRLLLKWEMEKIQKVYGEDILQFAKANHMMR
ncbi:hypothetical protein QVA66_05800 [Staphylococcus chromogenes]|nr:hypothetical protein [Staphylococcus chromogenes]